MQGLKRRKSDVDHSPLSGAEVKNKWSCASAPRIYLHGVVVDNFTFTSYKFYATFVRNAFKLDLVSHFVNRRRNL